MSFIARELSAIGISLDHPHTIRDGVHYQNPQWPFNPYTKQDMNHHISSDGKEIMLWLPSDTTQVQKAKKHQRGLFKRMFRF